MAVTGFRTMELKLSGVQAGRETNLKKATILIFYRKAWLLQQIWNYLLQNADGSNPRQVTKLGQANWAPNFLPDSKRMIFCSNHEYKRGFPFNMYVLDAQGNSMEKISRDNGFDAFPMFSPDGRRIVFCSNRNNGGTRDTNIFLADWVE